ncbi:hypothetical protein JK386_07475 [Nocardioides sp. zg-536]|uniref:Uncharacterized protein n=1 Tax=Nocardioides faecalis TaxID=2803858 RepID=A0A938Y5R3_9ACTN|nr:hypothetical protein [Nocardioides faecalis]MBM9459740.1 hypothetical protein [Nocardioides faecalis]MBS4753483.1 hypothetical protein [Nocardioides faecalis]QVI58257.1 hypothetical protein KG111_14770 [Nocardioides faecalis]
MLPELAGLSPKTMAKESPKGLELAEDEITKVIKELQEQIKALEENRFEVDAHIAKSSLGQADLSPALARHHARAHGVVTDTLSALLLDLQKFQTAVREARGLIGSTDAAAEQDLKLILAGTEDLDLGRYAYDRAQRDHVHTPATDEPVADPGADPGAGPGVDPVADPGADRGAAAGSQTPANRTEQP